MRAPWQAQQAAAGTLCCGLATRSEPGPRCRPRFGYIRVNTSKGLAVRPLAIPLAALTLLLAPAALLAAEPALPAGCDGFAWDVRQELAVLRSPGHPVEAARMPQAAQPPIALGLRHDLSLHPQREVSLAARPGKPMLEDDATAGMVALRVPVDGRYRISLTSAHWLDVVDAGKVLPSVDFQGRRGCPLVHKIVEFDLPAGRDLLLQLSGGDAAVAGIAVTAVAAAK